MAWTTARTWVAAETVTASLMNTHVRDNLTYLYDRGPALLKANSGTSTAAGATSVDTFLVTGLTAKDTLVAYMTLASVTQNTAVIANLYNSTDGVSIVSDGTLSAGTTIHATGIIRQAQSGATKVMGYLQGVDHGGNTLIAGNLATFTTNWTGSWALDLRHGGVTGGGTFQWSWAVYHVKGQ